MHWPSDPTVRPPVVAGRFYPADPEQCQAQARSVVHPNPLAAKEKRWLGAIAPHAGWICSGAIAGQAIATLAQAGPVDVLVIFGAVHTPLPLQAGALDSHQRWALPGAHSDLARQAQERLAGCGDLFVTDGRFHAREHSIEVLLPLVRQAFGNTPILPVAVPVLELAEAIGRKTAQLLAQAQLRAAYLASTDLTHYGANYGFMPAGSGPAAMAWAKDNDRRLLALIEELAADKIIPEVRQSHNACGGGAVAALLGACREAGATSARVLEHATSYETLALISPQPATSAVGYAGVVVG